MQKTKRSNCRRILASLLAGIAVLHIAEWFTVGKKIAEAAKIPEKEAMGKCLLMGIIWWKPLQKSLIQKQPPNQQDVQ